MTIQNISTIKATKLFLGFTLYFFMLLFTLLPFLKTAFILNSAVYWFITGLFLFIPLFSYAILKVKKEGNKNTKEIMLALKLKSLSKRDWKYSILGLVSVFLIVGLIYGLSMLLTHYFGIRPLNSTVWFTDIKPFQGSEKLLLLIWFPMFFFNIFGEELLWRGYIQTRLKGEHSWILCAFLWMLFHLPFGIDILILAIPCLFIIPYIFHKTQNTTTGIFIHALFNGPIFVLIALGLMH